MRNIEKAGFSLASILLEISPQVLPIAFEKAGKRDSFRERWGGHVADSTIDGGK
jgi:hypothetical protein